MAAVYTIRHPSSGVFYFGSTIDINMRKATHLYQLRNGTHHSKLLQEVWNGDNNIAWEVNDVSSKETAEQLERSMIQAHKHNPLLANFSMAQPFTDATRAAMSVSQCAAWTDDRRDRQSRRMTGSKHSPETISKMQQTSVGKVVSPEMREAAAEKRRIQVMIDGTTYRTAQEAAKATGWSLPTVLKRVRSDAPEWATWTIVEK